MNRLLGVLLFLIALPAAAQVTTGKPGTPTLDTGETHFPDHLWLLNEGSGTTLEDDGDHTDHDLSLGATTGDGPDWDTDGTHGTTLVWVEANEDYAENTGISGLSGVQTACAITTLPDRSVTGTILNWSDNTQIDRFTSLVYQGDEDIETLSRFDNTTQTNASTQAGTGGFDFVCIRWSDTTYDWSLNGSNWATGSVSHSGLSAAINTFAVGARRNSSPGQFFSGEMVALMWWHADKDNTAIAAIYNSGNPWPVIGVDSSAPATFTAGPTPGTATTTTLPFTFTSDSTGTVYGVACPDGQAAPSVAQVLAGDCTGDVAAEATISEAVTATVGDSGTFTGLTAATTYDTHFAIDAAVDSAAIATVADQTTASVGAPTFAVAPSCSATTNGVSCTYTASATSTAYGVGVNPGDGAPTCTQIKAGQNDAGSAAIATGSDSNAGTSDTITVTGSNTPPRLDYHFCLNNGSGDGPVDSSQVNEDRSPRSGMQIVCPTSLASTSIFADTAYWDQDFAANDCAELSVETNESADCDVSMEADGDIEFAPASAGACDAKLTIAISYQDVSSETTGLFTAPTVGNFTTDDLVCVNNSAPEAGDELSTPLMWQEDEAISAIDLNAFFSDADGDALTFTLTTGSWPTGISQSGTGNKDVTGTPTTEDESGVALVITATDECGDSATFSFYNNTAKDVYVVNTWAVPDLDSMDASEAEDAIVAAAPWRVGNPGLTIAGYTCGTGQPFLTSADQDPNASEEATPFENIDITIVGAIIPDLTGLTQAEAIAAIEAICP